MNGESTVIAFEKLQNRQKERAKHSPSRIFVQCRSMFMEGLAERLGDFFAKVDEELFSLSDKSENNAMQAYYYNYMGYLRRQREALQGQYLRQLTGFFEAFWHNQPLPALGHATARLDELSLLENEVLEETLAINGMVEKGNELFEEDLLVLDQCFMALLGRPGQAIEINPVSPLAVCRLFAPAVRGLMLELELKLLIYKMFDKHVLSALGPLYHALRDGMAAAGFYQEADPGPQPKLPPRAEAAATAPRPRKPGKRTPPEPSSNEDVFETVRRLLEARRSRLGAPGQAPERQAAAVTDGAAVLDVLGLLPQMTQMLAGQNGVLSGEQMKQLIAQQVGLAGDGEEPVLERRVEDVIDMVGMIFLYILQDQHLPAAVKSLLAKLQIPVLKTALSEDAFFAQKNHPARLLLNSLAQAGMGLDGELDEADSPVYQKIEAVVERIAAEWNRNERLYFELLEDFTAFMAIEYRRNRAAEERARQATQTREQVRQAKKAVAQVIAAKLLGLQVSPVLVSFLCNAWKDVLVLAWLRQSRDAGDWSSAISLTDQLVDSMVSARDPAFPAPGERLPLEAVRSRLENLGYDQHCVSDLLKALEECRQPGQSEPAARLPWDEGEIRDPEFAIVLAEIEDKLLRDAEAAEGRGAAASESQGAAQSAAPPGAEDESIDKACSLGIGQWVEFTEGQCKLRRAKLLWKSRERDVHIFVNAKGTKIVEMDLADLAHCFKNGAAKVIEDPCAPLMDRALSRLMQALENPACAFVP